MKRCPCGKPATQRVAVHWKNGTRVYWYCDKDADEIVTYVGGTELLP